MSFASKICRGTTVLIDYKPGIMTSNDLYVIPLRRSRRLAEYFVTRKRGLLEPTSEKVDTEALPDLKQIAAPRELRGGPGTYQHALIGVPQMDVRRLLECLATGEDFPDELCIPDVWKIASHYPECEREIIRDQWQLAHDVAIEAGYVLDDSRDSLLEGGDGEFVPATWYIRKKYG